jgi:hypothetical protein
MPTLEPSQQDLYYPPNMKLLPYLFLSAAVLPPLIGAVFPEEADRIDGAKKLSNHEGPFSCPSKRSPQPAIPRRQPGIPRYLAVNPQRVVH